MPPLRRGGHLSRRVFLRVAPLTALGGLTSAACSESPVVGPEGEFVVTDFFPKDFRTDGTVSYRTHIERAIRSASGSGAPLRFPAMGYLVDDEDGIRLESDLVMLMDPGAVFRTAKSFTRDGQLFRGDHIRNLRMVGGEIAGERDSWEPHVNVAGIRLYGRSSGIVIEKLFVHDVSSNAVGIFGDHENRMATNVRIRGLHAERCCNIYIDYLEPNYGPVRGTSFEDQGEIAMYFVKDFRVEECILEQSRSDATHFYRCEDGEIVKNEILTAKMGGYFIEWCTNVNGRENIVRGNGSRGVSLEYGSTSCSFDDNLVEFSGREGCWANDNVDTKITNNVFRENGRKRHHPVSASIAVTDTARLDLDSRPRARNVVVSGNYVSTYLAQLAAVWVSSSAVGVVVEGNTLAGENHVVHAEALVTGWGQVVVRGNDGWRTENGGVAVFSGTGSQRAFSIPHGLDLADPQIRVGATVTADSPDAGGQIAVTTDPTAVRVRYADAPPAGTDNVRLKWTAAVGSATA